MGRQLRDSVPATTNMSADSGQDAAASLAGRGVHWRYYVHKVQPHPEPTSVCTEPGDGKVEPRQHYGQHLGPEAVPDTVTRQWACNTQELTAPPTIWVWQGASSHI